MASSITQSGGYDYGFVDTNLPDEFQCPICTLVPRDVHQVSCCGKMFCKSCLDELKRTSTNYTCPNCRTDLTNNCFKDSNMNRKIRNLHIYCNNKKCLWKGSLQDIEKHLSTCPFQIIECSNKCGTQLKRSNLKSHLVKCPNRIVQCPCCKITTQYRSISIHLTQCPDYPLLCPNNDCRIKVKRHLINEHRTVCPHEMVKCSNGCGFGLKRHELDIHLHNTCRKRIVSCVYCHKQDEYQIINGDHNDKECPDYPLPCPNNGCEKKIKRHLMRKHRDTCPKEEVDCHYSNVGCHEKMKREDLCQHNKDKMEKHLHSAVHSIEKLKHTIKQLEQQQVTKLKMAGFEALKETNTTWYSPDFYSHLSGYKLCLEVDANGDGDAEDTHVSCFINLVPGEYDDTLEWPFQGEVTVELLNQLEDKNHYKHVIYFNHETPDDCKCRKKEEEEEDTGVWGEPLFIPHTKLGLNYFTNIQYLMNDTLYFRVSVEVHSTKLWLAGAI